MRFENKVGIFTGAASGMAYLTSECFAREGGYSVMADVNPEALEKKVAEVNARFPGHAIGVVCDVRDYAQVTNACTQAVEKFGSLDLVVNFAGGSETRILGYGGLEFADVPIEVFDWGLDVNLKGQFYFCHAALQQMRKQRSGVIVNIGSCVGEEGSSFDIAYATSKAGAMYGLTKSVARAAAPYGVRCVCVAPGPVLTRAAMANMKTLEGRAAEPQEIVDMVLYLASEQGAFVNGTTIQIDGGRSAMGRS